MDWYWYRHPVQIGDRQFEVNSFCKICRGHQRALTPCSKRERESQKTSPLKSKQRWRKRVEMLLQTWRRSKKNWHIWRFCSRRARCSSQVFSHWRLLTSVICRTLCTSSLATASASCKRTVQHSFAHLRFWPFLRKKQEAQLSLGWSHRFVKRFLTFFLFYHVFFTFFNIFF